MEEEEGVEGQVKLDNDQSSWSISTRTLMQSRRCLKAQIPSSSYLAYSPPILVFLAKRQLKYLDSIQEMRRFN